MALWILFLFENSLLHLELLFNNGICEAKKYDNILLLLSLGAVSDMQMQEHFDEFFEVTFLSHLHRWASNASQ